MASYRGIPLSKVSPAFLHANSTSHTWVFSAFAEIIDNAYDPDVSASELVIDKVDIHGVPCMMFLDNGAGMDRDQLLKMLSFGFCEKDIYEKQGTHLPIGHYGNGFKSGSMRIGQDALVFTRCQKSTSVGFLSQTFLATIQSDSVVVPILEYRLPNIDRIKSQESRNNLDAILHFSVFKTEDELKDELKSLECSKTGTKIIIYNLKRLKDGNYELDFSSDPTDIRCPEAHEADLTSVYHRPIQNNGAEYKRSLREYCSILFLRPRMKITIRGVRVKSKLISKSLSNTEIDTYKPTWLERPMKIIFGFVCEKGQADINDYGMMLYHRNRLIRAFEKVGYQRQPSTLGVGVVGVAQVDFLQPIHNKQDFNKDEKFHSVMLAFANKLNDYWNEKKGLSEQAEQPAQKSHPDWVWVQCDHCLKWRRLPDEIDPDTLPNLWYCRMNQDATHNRCDIPEEPEDEDLAVRPTYEKTFKKKQGEKKRLLQREKVQEEEARRRSIMEKEKELKEREAKLRAMQQIAVSQPMSRTVASLEKALVDAQQREEQQKLLIIQMQEQNKLMEHQKNSLRRVAESFQAATSHSSEDVLNQISKIINNFSPSAALSSPATKGKRKSSGGDTPVYEGKDGKRICIQTDTGEMLSITQNDIDTDDCGENNTACYPPSAASMSALTNGQKQNSSRSFELCHSESAPANNVKQNTPSTQSSLEICREASLPAVTPMSSTRSKRRNQRNTHVTAVIDLTLEGESGDLIDARPDFSAAHESLKQYPPDVKPNKRVIDGAISKRDEITNAQGPFTATTKQEVIVPHPQDIPICNIKEAGYANMVQNNKKGIHFGLSGDDPGFQMSIPDSFQENLEAINADFHEKMTNIFNAVLASEDNSTSEKELLQNAEDNNDIDDVGDAADDDNDYRDCSSICEKEETDDKKCETRENRNNSSEDGSEHSNYSHYGEASIRQCSTDNRNTLHYLNYLHYPDHPMSVHLSPSPSSDTLLSQGSSLDETAKTLVHPKGRKKNDVTAVKRKQENCPSLDGYVDSKLSHDQCVQTDLDMLALTEMFRKQDHSEEKKKFHDDSSLSEVKPMLYSNQDDKSLQSSELGKVFLSAKVQTQDSIPEDSQTRTVEELKQKLSLKSLLYEDLERQLTETRVNIHKLLGLIVPETELGDVDRINEVVIDIIKLSDDSNQ